MDTIKTDIRKAQDERFNWINHAGKSYRRAQSDISVSCVTYGGEKFAGLSFTFRNDVYQFFGESVEFAVYKNRLVFRTADKGTGLKFFSASNTCPNRYIKFRLDEDSKVIKDKFIGDYELQYDSFYELYYIEAKES